MSIKSNQEVDSAEERTIAELRQVFTGMQDTLTDEMVGRLAQTLSGVAGMLDQIERSGVDEAIPVLARMVENGDLAKIAQLVRVIGAVQDSVTDEMIVRLTDVISGAMTLLDRLNRTDLDGLVTALPRMVAMFDYLEQQHVVNDLMRCLEEATAAAAASPQASGGMRGLWAIARESDTQEALRFLLSISKQFRICRSERQAPTQHS